MTSYLEPMRFFTSAKFFAEPVAPLSARIFDAKPAEVVVDRPDDLASELQRAEVGGEPRPKTRQHEALRVSLTLSLLPSEEIRLDIHCGGGPSSRDHGLIQPVSLGPVLEERNWVLQHQAEIGRAASSAAPFGEGQRAPGGFSAVVGGRASCRRASRGFAWSQRALPSLTDTPQASATSWKANMATRSNSQKDS